MTKPTTLSSMSLLPHRSRIILLTLDPGDTALPPASLHLFFSPSCFRKDLLHYIVVRSGGDISAVLVTGKLRQEDLDFELGYTVSSYLKKTYFKNMYFMVTSLLKNRSTWEPDTRN